MTEPAIITFEEAFKFSRSVIEEYDVFSPEQVSVLREMLFYLEQAMIALHGEGKCP